MSLLTTIDNKKIIPTKGTYALDRILGPLARHWKDALSVEEIAICDPGRVFLRLRKKDNRGHIWKERKDEALTLNYLDMAVRSIANVYGEDFNGREKAAFFLDLPQGHRFSCVRGRAVAYGQQTEEGGIALAIRNPTPDELSDKLTTADWGVTKDTKTLLKKKESPLSRQAQKGPDESSLLHEDLMKAAHTGVPIMISGATTSGKTTLLNLLMKQVNKNLRVITVEDTRELKVENANRSHLLMHRSAKEDQASIKGLSSRQVVDCCMRLTPDILAVSEISTGNAPLALELLKSGHSHFWTTIHAGNCLEAFDTFVDRIHHTNKQADADKIIRTLRKKFIVLQLENIDGERKITETLWPTGDQESKALGEADKTL